MSTENDLETLIEKSRKVSENGSLVTYDLTSGIDFSNPKRTAEALANVFFEKDASSWFTVSGEKVDFNPTYKVRVVLAEEHNKKLEQTVDDFLRDLQGEELSRKFTKQISEEADQASRFQSIMAVGAIRSAVFRHTEDRVYSESIRDDLFIDLLEKLEIRSLNDKDLMDWKNLPL